MQGGKRGRASTVPEPQQAKLSSLPDLVAARVYRFPAPGPKSGEIVGFPSR